MKFFIKQINKMFLSVLIVLSCNISALGNEYVTPARELEKIGGFSFRYYRHYNLMPQTLDDLKLVIRQDEARKFDMYKRFGYVINLIKKNDQHIVITFFDGEDNYELTYFVSGSHCFFMKKNGKLYCVYKLNEDGSVIDNVFYREAESLKDDDLLPF